ncbi:MAG: hypothetical protein J7J28_04580, partial [Thaumarchaeota archaeon]|nr:hypothetical protein [Nitrososphaerota archaeon]
MTRIRLPAWLKEVYGKINKGVVVFRRWKGRIVLEVDPSPSYTRTALQDSIRKFFKNCIQQWHQLSEAEKEQYNQEARKYGLTGYQYFIKQCMSHWAPAPEQYIEITITEQSGQDLTDYQVLLVVQNDQAFFDFVQDPTYIEIYDSDKT